MNRGDRWGRKKAKPAYSRPPHIHHLLFLVRFRPIILPASTSVTMMRCFSLLKSPKDRNRMVRPKWKIWKQGQQEDATRHGRADRVGFNCIQSKHKPVKISSLADSGSYISNEVHCVFAALASLMWRSRYGSLFTHHCFNLNFTP